MKKLLTLLVLLTGSVAMAQPNAVPTVPTRTDFAGISVQFDESARRIIQQDVNALYANRQFWNAKLDRVVLYFPIIEAILTEDEVPTDFKYLAVQESSLTPDAVSSSQAVGFWQFKRETALINGLRVDDEIDERKSITGSTHGAATYLKKGNAQYNNWVSALYSFYLGIGGVSKLIPPDWAYAKEITLNEKTDRYMLRFFAHKIAVESALPFYKSNNPVALLEYPNGGGKTVQQIVTDLGASGIQVNTDDLLTYNRWILGESVPADKKYVVMIPVPNTEINEVRERLVAVGGRKTPDFVQNDVGFPVLKKVTLGVRSAADPILYEINGLPGIQAQAGDEAAGLARKARISYSSFLRYNDMSEKTRVVPGEVYYLAKKRKKALVPFHTTLPGETSRSISQRYGIRLSKLIRYNRIEPKQKLQTGRVMWLRERRPRKRPVEIINVPTPPVTDPTPITPDVADNTNATVPSRPANSENIPRNPSERKVYTPKFGGENVPTTTTTEPIPTPTPERSRPTPDVNMERPTATTSRPATPPTTTGSSNGTTRTVTVKPATPSSQAPANDEDDRLPTVPTKTAKQGGFEVTGNEPTSTPTTTPSRTRPTAPATTPTSTGATTAKTPTPAPATPKTGGVGRAVTHTVEAGQTYYSISKLYNVQIDDILAANNLTLDDKLAVGQQLTIRNAGAGTTAPAAAQPAAPKQEVVYHTVEKGQTMFRISKLYNVTIEQIQQWNGLTDVAVKEGQKIKIVK
jgi:membrane-bound lytic murein transglycosylase D